MTKYNSFLLVAFSWIFVASVSAAPFNTAVIDGRLREYDMGEWVGTNTMGTSTQLGSGNDVRNLFVTWDETYLYIALEGHSGQHKMGVFIDAQPGVAGGAVTTTNWVNNPEGYIAWNSAGWQAADPTGVEFGLDYFIINQGSGGFNNILQILYNGIAEPNTNNVVRLFDQQNGGTPTGGAVDMATWTFDDCGHAVGLETRIPWSVFYANNQYGTVLSGEVVPRNASIRMFATVFNNRNDSFQSKNRKIPNLQLSEWNDSLSLITSEFYVDVIIDGNGDGFPDNIAPAGNPPYLLDAMGKAEGTVVYARFNQPVDAASATNPDNWDVGGLDIDDIELATANAVYITLIDPLPEDQVTIFADGVESTGTGSRESFVCFTPVEEGLDEPILVRFVLETNSGMGANITSTPQAHRATNFFLNGSAPLDWGFPPARTTPITNVLAGSLRYVDVIYPPGSPLEVEYKFSALLRGTNNYEAIRLDKYQDMARVLTLNPDAPDGIMVVTNRLGAAAAPLRQGETGHRALYLDTRRGDAGVPTRKNITLELDLSDLSAAERASLQRVFVQGSDPLRGFNWTGSGGEIDFNGRDDITIAGLNMTDDGTGIFQLNWALTEDGRALDLVPDPFGFGEDSLVGGNGVDDVTPFIEWLARRSPRSFSYKFYIINAFNEMLEWPGDDIDIYVEPGDGTNLVFRSVWGGRNPVVSDDPDQYPDPTHPAEITAITTAEGVIVLDYENLPDQQLHLVDIASDLSVPDPWQHFGQVVRPFISVGSVDVQMWNEDVKFARVRAARPAPRVITHWSPNPIPPEGGTVRIHFHQTGRNLEGHPTVYVHASVDEDGEQVPDGEPWFDYPMTFEGDGKWSVDLAVSAGINDRVRFVFRDGSGNNIWDGDFGYPNADQYRMHVGGRATWTPEKVVGGGSLTVTYDASTGPLQGEDKVWIHAGFDKFEGSDWSGTIEAEMSNVGADLWEHQLQIPTNFSKTVHFLFHDDDKNIWDNFNDPMHWHAFFEQD